MWRDEAVTYDMAHRSLPDLWLTLGKADVVHGLYYVLMHGVFAVWDGGLLALRLPSVLAVAAGAAGVALLGERLASRRAGLLAGLAFALLPDVQRYAQEGRSYAMVCACLTWATWFFVRALDEPCRVRLWAGYAATALAACWLHEFAVLAVAAHGVTLRLTGGSYRGWTPAAACVAAGLAPLAAYSQGQSGQVDWIGPPDPLALLKFALLVSLGIVLARMLPAARLLRWLALPLLVLPATTLLLLTPLRPLYVDRYVLCYAIGFSLLTGAVLDRTWQHRRRVMAAAAAVAAALVLLLPVGLQLRTPDSRIDDLDAIARAVESSGEPGDGLLFMPARRRAWRLGAPGAYQELTDLALDSSPRASHTLYGVELSARRIRARMLAADRIVVLRDPLGQPLDSAPEEAVKRAVLRAWFTRCATREVKGARITSYDRSGAC